MVCVFKMIVSCMVLGGINKVWWFFNLCVVEDQIGEVLNCNVMKCVHLSGYRLLGDGEVFEGLNRRLMGSSYKPFDNYYQGLN